jgi:lysophospholipase L1-like esterase
VPVKVSKRKKLFFILVVFVACFGLLEGGLRIFWERPPARLGDGLRNAGLYVRDPVLGWRALPNRRVIHKAPGHDVIVTTNSRGFRDVEHGPKKTGVPRVVVIGDSFPLGYGVADDENFVCYLREDVPGAEFVNLGVTAYNLRRTHTLLRAEGLGYEPDLVLLSICQNDICLQEETSYLLTRKPRPSNDGLKQALNQHCYVYAALRIAVSRCRPLSLWLVDAGLKEPLAGYEGLDTNVRTALREYPPALQHTWEVMGAELTGIKKTCDEAGVPLLVAAIPAREAVEPDVRRHGLAYSIYQEQDFDHDKPYAALGALCRELGCAYVCPLEAFRKEKEEGLYSKWDIHFSPKGHRLFAKEIAPQVREALPVGP